VEDKCVKSRGANLMSWFECMVVAFRVKAFIEEQVWEMEW